MDVLTPEQRHKNMSHIRSNNTSIEILLRKALWREGIRYRKNYNKLPGKPDIAITKYKIAIFCDGELWHGKDWKNKKKRIKTNRDYWIQKIERNIARDTENEKKLEGMCWTVIRFWGNEIKKNLTGCVDEIKEAIYEIEKSICGIEYEQEYNESIDLMVAEDEHSYNTDNE
ncbi:MAG: very short patch repair endonuclease [Spirochaetales bacterium]|jgi:DNA mismatch endonuclease (patch repair protein)|nr:very short patch repair endonuclease [Spirochaetales bacterium]